MNVEIQAAGAPKPQDGGLGEVQHAVVDRSLVDIEADRVAQVGGPDAYFFVFARVEGDAGVLGDSGTQNCARIVFKPVRKIRAAAGEADAERSFGADDDRAGAISGGEVGNKG